VLATGGLLLTATRRELVSNQLVLVVPQSSNRVKDLPDLVRPEVRIVALGELATVPRGMHARQTLEQVGLLATAEKKAVYAEQVRCVHLCGNRQRRRRNCL
jgi:molybdate transport system substrate-binding protein